MATATVPHTSPVSPTQYTPLAYHAAFDGLHGTALRDSAGACWFIADDGTLTLLHNDDTPFLHLNGRVDIAAEQRLLDDLAGGMLAIVEARNTEHARVAA